MKNSHRFGLTLALLLTSGLAWSASADEVVRTCKAAIADSEGSDYSAASLMRVNPRRNSYETWFNVADGDREFKSYCYVKRGEVQELVTTDGRWSKNPKRPKPGKVASAG